MEIIKKEKRYLKDDDQLKKQCKMAKNKKDQKSVKAQ